MERHHPGGIGICGAGKDEGCQQDAGGPARAWNATILGGIGICGAGKDEGCQQDADGPVFILLA